jgi:tetratricopeptide (TPR) repeat protein
MCRQDLAATRSHLGLLLCRLGQQAEARTACSEAMSIRTKLVEDSPDYLTYTVELAESQCHMGRLALEEGKLETMRDWYAQAIKTLQPPLEKQVQVFEVDRLLRFAHLGRARALTRLGSHNEAKADWDDALRLINIRPGRGDVLFEAALTCAEAATASKSDRALRDQYAGRALFLLAKAKASDYFKDPAAVAAVKSDGPFADLRGRPEFDKLLTELTKP